MLSLTIAFYLKVDAGDIGSHLIYRQMFYSRFVDICDLFASQKSLRHSRFKKHLFFTLFFSEEDNEF